jgi:hypothetical protein
MPQPLKGHFRFADWWGPREQARAFGGPVLIAAEETRSCADGQNTQMASRADAARAGPRPAFCRWYRLQSG